MKKLYEKSEIWFAVAWIIVYVVVMGNLRGNFGDESLYSMLAALVMAVVLTVFIVRNRLTERFGLVLWTDSRKYLYFIPFILLCTVNLWFGVSLHGSMGRQIVAVMTMALVAYVEEIIFRGLLFRAIEKDSEKQAIVISAVTFGAGHIAREMVNHMLSLLDANQDVVVTTYREGDPEGVAARAFYKHLGFEEGRLTEEFGSPVQEFILWKR